MKSAEYITFVCNNAQEVVEKCEQLDRAKLVDIQVNDGGVIKPVNNFKGVYNVSRGLFVNSVVPYYQVVQHKDYFASFADSLERLNIKYNMKITQVGNKAFADIEFEGRNIEFKNLNEEFTTGIRLINSYDKSTGIFVVPLFKRLACLNGMIVTREEEFSIRHHSKMAQEIDAYVERSLNRIINEAQDLQLLVSESMRDSIEWETMCKILGKLIEQLNHREEILKRLGIDMIIKGKGRNKGKSEVTYVWTDTTKKKEKFTRWEIYNAITQYISHGEHITPLLENYFQHRAEKLLKAPLVMLAR